MPWARPDGRPAGRGAGGLARGAGIAGPLAASGGRQAHAITQSTALLAWLGSCWPEGAPESAQCPAVTGASRAAIAPCRTPIPTGASIKASRVNRDRISRWGTNPK